ncbi:hypothetical protein EUTSA_v10003080mg [Eutrema salsugineum]|uniref:Uncharacterized protein n=1 Tax=Eutrema salsugineum TaxID=72664 RepID=V4L514_EUTSA|nr:hypothetical protein EUTSA_v10003080mg [Eutrema salsugineum]
MGIRAGTKINGLKEIRELWAEGSLDISQNTCEEVNCVFMDIFCCLQLATIGFHQIFNCIGSVSSRCNSVVERSIIIPFSMPFYTRPLPEKTLLSFSQHYPIIPRLAFISDVFGRGIMERDNLKSSQLVGSLRNSHFNTTKV